MEVITSTQNPAVKRMKALASRKGRLEQGCFLLEGPKLVGEALAAGFALTAVLVQESEWEAFEGLAERAGESGAVVSQVSRAAMESASDARTPQGILAAARLPAAPPPDQYAAGLWAVLDGVQDPGNMGTILRSADAMGAKGILLGPGCADPWSPKAIRSAMGSTFHVLVEETEDLPGELGKMRAQGFEIIAGHLRGNGQLPQRLPERVALLIGSEGQGLSDAVSAQASLLYRLPMRGRAESLNAAVCAGILLYELSGRMPGREENE